MGRTLLALTPRYPEPGGKPFEIHWSGLGGSLQPASVDTLAELGLGSAGLSDQMYRIGLSLETPQCRLALLSDSRVSQDSSYWQCWGVVAFDNPGTNAGLLLELWRQARFLAYGFGRPRQPLAGYENVPPIGIQANIPMDEARQKAVAHDRPSFRRRLSAMTRPSCTRRLRVILTGLRRSARLRVPSWR